MQIWFEIKMGEACSLSWGNFSRILIFWKEFLHTSELNGRTVVEDFGGSLGSEGFNPYIQRKTKRRLSNDSSEPVWYFVLNFSQEKYIYLFADCKFHFFEDFLNSIVNMLLTLCFFQQKLKAQLLVKLYINEE